MNQLYKFVAKNPLVKNNVVLFVGSILVAALNYLIYPAIGRFVTPTEFGEIQILATLSTQITLVYSVARLVIINQISNIDKVSDRNKFFVEAERLVLLSSVVFSIFALIFGPIAQSLLHYRSVWIIYSIVPVIILASIKTTRDSYLRGILKFKESSKSEFFGAIARLSLALLTAIMGFGVYVGSISIVGGYLIMAIMIYTYSLKYKIPKLRVNKILQHFSSIKNLIGNNMTGSIIVAIAGMTAAAFANIDTIFAKHYLDPNTAGLYSSISIIANIVLFGTASIAGVMLSSVKIYNPAIKNIRTYIFSILLLILLSATIIAVFSYNPDIIIKIMLGDKFTVYSELLPRLTLAMATMAFVNLIITYHMALRHKSILLVAVLSMIVITYFLNQYHSNPHQIVRGFLIGNLAALIICVIYTITINIRLSMRVKQ